MFTGYMLYLNKYSNDYKKMQTNEIMQMVYVLKDYNDKTYDVMIFTMQDGWRSSRMTKKVLQEYVMPFVFCSVKSNTCDY